MILMHYYYLLAVVAAADVRIQERQPRTNFLQTVSNYLEPFVVNLVNTLENVIEGNGNTSVADEDYDLSEESDEDDDDDRTIFNMFKKKKKKKPQVENPQGPVKPGNSDKPDASEQKPSKPTDKPSQSAPNPSTHEIKQVQKGTTATGPANTGPPTFYGLINRTSDEVKIMHPFLKLSAALNPKREALLITSTVVVETTVVNTIFPSCLEMHNVHSVCEDDFFTIVPSHTHTLPSGNIWRSELPNSEGEKIGNETKQEGRELNDQSMPKIRPTATLPSVQTTRLATLDEKRSRSYDAVTSIIEDTESNTGLLSKVLTATPDLVSALPENNTSDGRILPYFLKPKIEYTTKFLDKTVTKHVYDYSHTATVIAVNCAPTKVLTLPPCSPEKLAPGTEPSDEAYYSHFIQMIKGQSQSVPNLSTAEVNYLLTKILPTYHETTQHDNVASMDEHVLRDGLQIIRRMIYDFVVNGGLQGNN